MLRFKLYSNDPAAGRIALDGAHLLGTDGVPVRADITYADGEIRCSKRTQGSAGLVVLWPVKSLGRILLETTRLVERQKPYNLHVELARGRLLRIEQKREDFLTEQADKLDALVARIQQLLPEMKDREEVLALHDGLEWLSRLTERVLSGEVLLEEDAGACLRLALLIEQAEARMEGLSASTA